MFRGIDQQEMARRNRAAALGLIRRSGGISRKELADRLDLSSAALTRIASDLLDSGVVSQEAVLNLSPDQPRAILRLNAEWAYVITISLTVNLTIGVVDLAGNLVHLERLAGDDARHDAYHETFDELLPPALTRLIQRHEGARLLGIGALSYGSVDRRGIIRLNASLPRRDFDLAAYLAPFTSLPVHTDEEFRLLLRAKQWSADPAEFRNVVAMSGKLFGVGGGHAMLAEGAVVYGANGFAGQPGWAAPVLHGVERDREMDALVRRLGGTPAYLEVVRRNDPAVAVLYGLALENYGYRVAQLINYFNPELVLLYTAYAALGQAFLDRVWEETRRHAAELNLEGVRIEFGGARTDEEHTVAAAMPVLDRFFSEPRFDTAPSEAMAAV